MPTYQYRCKECGADLEVVQKFTDDALTTCPTCGRESLRKVYNAVGVHFKGSGFYRTDSRSTGSGGADSRGTGSGTGSGEGGTKAASGEGGPSSSTPSATKSAASPGPASGSATSSTAGTGSD